MTSAIAPRRFTRLEVQQALVGVPVELAEYILARLGTASTHYGTSVQQALELMFAQNRPTNCSPNTYAGMSWDSAIARLYASLATVHDHAGLWDVLLNHAAIARAHTGFERVGYETAIAYASWFVEQQFGARPAPPPAPPEPANLNQALAQILVDPKMNQDALEIVEEQDFPMLFERSLMAMVRVWVMMPKGARRFAANQLAGWLRSIGADGAAAEVESLD